MNNLKKIILLLFAISFLLWSCDYGQLGSADQTKTVSKTVSRETFIERLDFFDGVWYSRYPGIGLLDGYRIRKWSDVTADDTAKAHALFPSLNIANPKTYATQDFPQSDDYVVLYDDTVYGKEDDNISGTTANWGFAYMGIVRAINIFNDDKNRGAIIIEYFEGADPQWLSDPSSGYKYQGLKPGEKPFFGIYYRVISPDVIQFANAVDLAAMYAGNLYYTEKRSLEEAIAFNSVENESELISWGVVMPQHRK